MQTTAKMLSTTENKKISLIIPCFNEEQGLKNFHRVVSKTMEKINITCEIIYVDDGSSDNTPVVLEQLESIDPRVTFLQLSRNFGKEAALTAGIDHAMGDAVIPIDADLQDPPELIVQMVEAWQSGADVVMAKRSSRSGDTLSKKFFSGAYYWLHKKLTNIEIPSNVGDFRLMDREVVDSVKRLHEKNRYMKGLFSWVGYKTVYIDFDRTTRASGKTSFNFRRLLGLGLNGIFSFSAVPLKIWLRFGLAGILLSSIYIVIVMYKVFTQGIDVPGYASLLVAIFFMGSLQLVGLGVLGEYIGRIYEETKNRPIYIIKNKKKTRDGP